MLTGLLLLAAATAATAPALTDDDPFAWLEDVSGERAMTWVKEQNARSTPELEARPEFQPIYKKTLEILDSKDKIPTPELRGTTVYNFWKDEQHPRGIWRRTPLDSYRTAQPAWETVLDVDALAKAEDAPWVFKGAGCLPPAYRRCLVELSRGGADATTVREFDAQTKAFVPNGFTLKEAKSSVGWRSEDEVWVGTDFGEGSLTTSGYPRIVKRWKRGTPLTEARTVFSCPAADVGCYGFSRHTPEQRYDLVVRYPAIYSQEVFLVLEDRLVKLQIPEDAQLRGVFKDQALISLRSDWTRGEVRHAAGSLLAIDLDDLLAGSGRAAILFEPGERVSLSGVASTRDRVLVETLDNVRGKLVTWTLGVGGWRREEVELPGLGTIDVPAASDEADAYLFTYTDFLTPSSLWLVQGGGKPEKVKALPAFFAPPSWVSQHEAVS
jgi:prolyl oligopeptidase